MLYIYLFHLVFQINSSKAFTEHLLCVRCGSRLRSHTANRAEKHSLSQSYYSFRGDELCTDHPYEVVMSTEMKSKARSGEREW